MDCQSLRRMEWPLWQLGLNQSIGDEAKFSRFMGGSLF
jgi:hypothetical protein